jgi:hypothetical protein
LFGRCDDACVDGGGTPHRWLFCFAAGGGSRAVTLGSVRHALSGAPVVTEHYRHAFHAAAFRFALGGGGCLTRWPARWLHYQAGGAPPIYRPWPGSLVRLPLLPLTTAHALRTTACLPVARAVGDLIVVF